MKDSRGDADGGVKTTWRLKSAVARPRVFSMLVASEGGAPAMLAAIADVVLPAEADRKAAVAAFTRWIANYKEGADTDHGYGNTRVRTTGPSPARNYAAQFAALDKAAIATGRRSSSRASASTSAALGSKRRSPQPQRERTARRAPKGAHVIADLRGYYCNSAPPRRDLATTPPSAVRPVEGSRALKGAGQEHAMPTHECGRLHHRRRHLGRHACAEAVGTHPRRRHHHRRSRHEDLRLREPDAVPAAEPRLRRERVARRLHRRPGRGRRHFADDGRWRERAALGRRDQPVLRRRPAAEVDVRVGGRLAARVEGTRAALLRGRASHRRVGGAESDARRQDVGAVPDAGDADDVQPRRLKAWAEKSGIPFLDTPQAKNTQPYGGRAQCLRCNTCEICPTGARYSPDFTFKQLIAAKKITLHDQTLVRRPRRQDDEDCCGDGGPQGRPPARSSTARRPSCSRRATPGRRICCCRERALSERPRDSSDHVGRYMTGHLARRSSSTRRCIRA